MAYAADYTLATSAGFISQVQMAATKAAVSIKAEARSIRPALDSKRQTFADRVLANESGIFQKIAYACVETGLAGTPIDTQVDTAVASVWNALAGVTPQDLA